MKKIVRILATVFGVIWLLLGIVVIGIALSEMDSSGIFMGLFFFIFPGAVILYLAYALYQALKSTNVPYQSTNPYVQTAVPASTVQTAVPASTVQVAVPAAGVQAAVPTQPAATAQSAAVVSSLNQTHPNTAGTSASSPEATPQSSQVENQQNATVSNTMANGAAPTRSTPSFTQLVSRSRDIIATLKDTVLHDNESSAYPGLVRGLKQAGIENWQEAPQLSCVRLTRNNCFWLGGNLDELSQVNYDRVLGVELLLNLCQQGDAQRRKNTDEDLLDMMARLIDIEPELSLFYVDPIKQRKEGEWSCRLSFSDYAENVGYPYRLKVHFDTNVANKYFTASVEVPRPDCFKFLNVSDTDRVCIARNFACRYLLLTGKIALKSAKSIDKLELRAFEQGANSPCLLVKCNARELKKLIKDASSDMMAALPISSNIYVKYRADNGWFAELPEELNITDDELLSRDVREAPVELVKKKASKEIRESCGATQICDLGIYENAVRVNAWNSISHAHNGSTEDAVSKLIALRDKSKDLSVSEACERTSKALIEGAHDINDSEALGELFVNGSALDRVSEMVRLVMSDENADIERAIAELEEVLNPIMEMGVYLDNTETIYRYFNSCAERVYFNLEIDDHSRSVSLVPDSYFNALVYAARIHTMLENYERANIYIDEAIRIAPVCSDATLLKVRALENQSQVFEASNILKQLIAKAPSARDMAVEFYRLAFMQWKLGKGDVAVACYQRSIALHPIMREQAEEELEDLLSSEELTRHNDEDLARVIEEAGIPFGSVNDIRTRVTKAAAAAADAGYFSPAWQLTGTLLDVRRDDALVDVYHSLRGD